MCHYLCQLSHLHPAPLSCRPISFTFSKSRKRDTTDKAALMLQSNEKRLGTHQEVRKLFFFSSSQRSTHAHHDFQCTWVSFVFHSPLEISHFNTRSQEKHIHDHFFANQDNLSLLFNKQQQFNSSTLLGSGKCLTQPKMLLHQCFSMCAGVQKEHYMFFTVI